MRPAAVFLAGLATTSAGILARTCTNTGIPAEFANAICGDGGSVLTASSHAHCAGCAVMAIGGMMLAIAALMHLATERRATARAGK